MARSKKPRALLVWTDVVAIDGALRGRYAIDGRMIVVRSAQGWEKTTQLGNPDAQVGLAHMMLSEAPPSSWRAPAGKL
jgi:hypothetical protein